MPTCSSNAASGAKTEKLTGHSPWSRATVMRAARSRSDTSSTSARSTTANASRGSAAWPSSTSPAARRASSRSYPPTGRRPSTAPRPCRCGSTHSASNIPRQWGACWLADQLWQTLHLDDFFGARLPVSRKDTDWKKVLRVLVIYRLLGKRQPEHSLSRGERRG